jgi:hypothetical protein
VPTCLGDLIQCVTAWQYLMLHHFKFFTVATGQALQANFTLTAPLL